MGCPVTEPRRGHAAEIFNSTCERRVLGLRARKDTRTTRGFRISTREVTSFTYRTTVSNFLLPLYTVTGSFLSAHTEKSEKSSDSRIHHPTGHTTQLWEIWFSVMPKGRATQLVLLKFLILTSDVAVEQRARPTEGTEKSTAARHSTNCVLFRDLLLRSYLYHCAWCGITGRISLNMYCQNP